MTKSDGINYQRTSWGLRRTSHSRIDSGGAFHDTYPHALQGDARFAQEGIIQYSSIVFKKGVRRGGLLFRLE